MLAVFGLLFLFGLYQVRCFRSATSFEWIDGTYVAVSESETSSGLTNETATGSPESTDDQSAGSIESGTNDDSSSEVSGAFDSSDSAVSSESSGSNSDTGSGTAETVVKVNLNTADSETLQTLKGIGPKTAEKILDYRKKAGRFETVEELMNVSGIGEKTLEKLRPYITVE